MTDRDFLLHIPLIHRRGFRSLLVTSSCLFIAGCPANLENPERFESGSTVCNIETLIAESCATSTCHDSMNPEGSLDLESAGVASRLVGVSATYDGVDDDPQNCPTDAPELLIDPANVDASLVLKKLEGTHTCGREMPNVPLEAWRPGSDSQARNIECFRQWVEDLAAGTGGAGTGGAGTGGTATGGTGGAATGGTGGAATGGTGGAATGGTSAGATGGTGGTASGGTGATGGTAGS